MYVSRCVINNWFLVQSLFGVEHDDFDYSKLGEYMTASLQQFVRESATEPANLANHSIQNLMLDSKLSEKVGVLSPFLYSG